MVSFVGGGVTPRTSLAWRRDAEFAIDILSGNRRPASSWEDALCDEFVEGGRYGVVFLRGDDRASPRARGCKERVMTRYAIVIEKAKRNYSAYAPDVPGCIAAGKTLKEVRRLMREALEFHFEAMAEDGKAIPAPTSCVEYVDVAVPVAPVSAVR